MSTMEHDRTSMTQNGFDFEMAAMDSWSARV